MTSSRQGTYRTIDVSDLLEKMPEVALWVRPRIELEIDDQSGERPPDIHRAAMGPLTASPCRDLVLVSAMPIWDVNGYYRALGIGWPYRPTKREMRDAYQVLGGPDDEYLTYCFKRLLDVDFRRHYDQRPLGKPVDDLYRWQEVLRKGAVWAGNETARTGMLHSLDDFTGELGAKIREHDEDRPKLAGPGEDGAPWPFGYYLWGSRNRDERTLSDWQSMLLAAMWEKGLSTHVAVGYVGHRTEPVVRVEHNGMQIVFLNDETKPTPELAKETANNFIAINQLDKPIGIVPIGN